MQKPHIYLDHSATTPVRQAVVDAMLPFWTEHFGNPSSSHAYGQAAKQGLEQARRTIARILNAKPSEIVFTGCGSEADNLALRGVMWAARRSGRGNHLITSIIEHEAVLGTAEQLHTDFGFDLTVVGVDQFGRVDPDEVAAVIRPDTALISIMAANNEIGTLQPILEIGRLAHEHGVLFHTDAIQAATVLPWDLRAMPIDLFCLAPHKFYGPKGVGILYVREGVELVSALTGGGQEHGRRAGTSNVAFAAGAAKALELATAERDTYIAHCTALRDRLIEGILVGIGEADIRLTGHPTDRLPHHASFALSGITGNDILMHLDMIGVAGSSGSACSVGNPEPSATLVALGLDERWTRGGLRLTVGRGNTLAEIEYVIAELPAAMGKLKAFVSLYS